MTLGEEDELAVTVTLGDREALPDDDGVEVWERLGDDVSLALPVGLGDCDWLDDARWDALGVPDCDGLTESDGESV